MQGIVDQLAVIAGDEVFLRHVIIWLSAASVFVLVLGGAFIGFSISNPVRERVGRLTGRA
jgi:hypothetical protein